MITILTSDTPDLRKTFGAGGQTAAGKLYSGYYQTWEPGVQDLALWLSAVRPDQCLCLGTPQRASGRICTTTDYTGDIDPIPRTDNHFTFNNCPTWFYIDIDGQSPDAVQRLFSIVPELATCGCIIKPSSNPNPDKYSWHIYIQAIDGTDIPAFIKRLGRLLWISGMGHVFISKTGGQHVRSLIDESVGSPERIIYEADPELLDGIVKPERETVVRDGVPLDTRCVAELDAGLLGLYDSMVAAELQRTAGEAAVIRQAYHQRTGIPEHVQDEILTDDDIIYLNRSTPLRVGDITTEHNNMTVCDPLEPEYNGWHNTVAKLWVDDNGTVTVRSNAHGMGKLYRYQGLMLRSAGFGVGVEVPVQAVAEKPVFNVSELEQEILHSGVTEHSESQVKTDLIEKCVSKCDLTDRTTTEMICQLLRSATGLSIGVLRSRFMAVMPDEPETHAEIAGEYVNQLDHSKVVGCDGAIWEYSEESGVFLRSDLSDKHLVIGTEYNGKYCKKAGDYKAIAGLMYNEISDVNFFNIDVRGIACNTGVYTIESGQVMKHAYSQYLKQRFKLDIDPIWEEPVKFKKYLHDSFKGVCEIEQTMLLQEVMGGIMIGCFSRIQRAVLLHGEGNNGKSVLMELLSKFFSRGMICAIKPNLFNNEYYLAQIAGKLINIVGELPQGKEIPEDFKDAVGCDNMMTGRHIHQSPFDFIPIAAHIFASNFYPMTRDHTSGFYRRWLILEFNNIVDASTKIRNYGCVLAEEEGPQILAWALQGAVRLINNNYITTRSKEHDDAMHRWMNTGDSVTGFLDDDEVVVRNIPDAVILKTELYQQYRMWCALDIKPLGRNKFHERCQKLFTEVRYEGKRAYRGVKTVYPGNAFESRKW